MSGCRAGSDGVGRMGTRTHCGGRRAPQTGHWLCLPPHLSPTACDSVSPAAWAHRTLLVLWDVATLSGWRDTGWRDTVGQPGWGCQRGLGRVGAQGGSQQHRSPPEYSRKRPAPQLHLTPGCRAPRAGCRMQPRGRAALGVPPGEGGGRWPWPLAPGPAALQFVFPSCSAPRCLRAAARCKFLRGGGSIFGFP